MEMAYEQFHVRVTIDSQHKNARVKCKSPKRTPESEREEKQTRSTKTGVAVGMEGGLTLGPRPQGTIKVAKTKANEETGGFEKKRYTSRITEHHRDGIIRWGFYVDDFHERERGIEFPDDALPTAFFEFVGNRKVPPPPPERMGLEITSYWSIIPENEEGSNWIRTFLNLSMSSGNSQATSYSNLCQIVSLETVPSDLPPRSDYKATMHVRPGVPDTDYISYYTTIDIPTEDSVTVTQEFSADDWREPSALKLPMIAELKLSEYYIKTLEKSGADIKSH